MKKKHCRCAFCGGPATHAVQDLKVNVRKYLKYSQVQPIYRVNACQACLDDFKEVEYFTDSIQMLRRLVETHNDFIEGRIVFLPLIVYGAECTSYCV